jgi:hypothetical protein
MMIIVTKEPQNRPAKNKSISSPPMPIRFHQVLFYILVYPNST